MLAMDAKCRFTLYYPLYPPPLGGAGSFQLIARILICASFSRAATHSLLLHWQGTADRKDGTLTPMAICVEFPAVAVTRPSDYLGTSKAQQSSCAHCFLCHWLTFLPNSLQSQEEKFHPAVSFAICIQLRTTVWFPSGISLFFLFHRPFSPQSSFPRPKSRWQHPLDFSSFFSVYYLLTDNFSLEKKTLPLVSLLKKIPVSFCLCSEPGIPDPHQVPPFKAAAWL